MPTLIPKIPFIRHRRVQSEASAPAVGPVLVEAFFDAGVLSLTFDQAIDVSGMLVNAFKVFDGTVPVEWGGTVDVTQDTPATIAMTMIENGEYAGSETTLSVAGGGGVVATVGGAAWAGVDDVDLPYSS